MLYGPKKFWRDAAKDGTWAPRLRDAFGGLLDAEFAEVWAAHLKEGPLEPGGGTVVLSSLMVGK